MSPRKATRLRAAAPQGHDLKELAVLIRTEEEGLLSIWREEVRQLPSARDLDTPTLNDHIPQLLQELATALELQDEQTIPEALKEGTPPEHGVQRLDDGFDIEEVVAEYNILRGCIHDLAEDHGLKMQGRPFHIVNRVLDQAIGLAVKSYADARAGEVQGHRAEYLAFVAHDLKTPLHVISIARRALERLVPPPETDKEAHQMFDALSRSVSRLEGLVAHVLKENKSLETEGRMKVERRDLDLWPLVEGLIRDVHPLTGGTGNNPRLINEVPEDLVVHADASLLRRVFQNLMSNAIRHTPAGEVVIGARQLDTTGAVECWVKDNGIGIKPEFVERVFVKGESSGDEGSGLGLAIASKFTEALGGKISVESKVGVGSTFRFSLPPAASPPTIREPSASG